MPVTASRMTVKVVGANGQISLGKQYAGRRVLVEEQAPGVWLVRTATVVPDNERWLHLPETAADLRAALDWAKAHPADDAGNDALYSPRITQSRRAVAYRDGDFIRLLSIPPDHDATYGSK